MIVDNIETRSAALCGRSPVPLKAFSMLVTMSGELEMAVRVDWQSRERIVQRMPAALVASIRLGEPSAATIRL